MFKTNQIGRTMIETIAVLAVITMVTRGLITIVMGVYNKYRISSITTQIKDLQKNIRTRYSAVANYADLSNASKVQELIKEKVIPHDMILSGQIVHAFGSKVEFNTDESKLKDEINGQINKYSITFKDVRREACVELLNLNWAVNESSDLLSITTRNKTYTWDSSTAATKLPLDGMRAMTICGQETGKDEDDKPITTDITWIFQ